MLGFFERQRLVKKGLAPHKTRRRRTESELLETLEHGNVAKSGILLLFAAGLAAILLWGSAIISTTNILVTALIFAVASAHLARWNRGGDAG